MKKKVLAMVMTLAMVLSLVPVTALAEEDASSVGAQSEQQQVENPGTQDENKGQENKDLTPTEGETEAKPSPTDPDKNEDEKPEESKDVAKIGETSYTSMKDAFAEAKPGDTIVLQKDITFETEKDSIEIKVCKNFNGELTIDLNGHYIDANDKGKCIWQANSQPSKLIVKNGTLKNGDPNAGVDLSKQSPSAGSAIQISEKNVSLEIINCTLENNKDSAVLPGSDLTVLNCKFINNHIRKSLSSQSGGAIKLAGANSVTIKDSEFIGNSAPSMGGAVYADHGTVDMANCKFMNNAAAHGGAIAVNETTITVKENVEFSFNQATVMGGAIHIQNTSEGKALNIENLLKLENNKATYGGAVSVFNSNVTLRMLEATKNYATYGGVIYVQSVGDASLEQSRLVENSAKSGGAIANYCSNITISSTIEDNRADVGGGLYLWDAENTTATIESGSLINNHATKYAADIYSGIKASLSIPATVSGTLADCNHAIDGWYYDKDGSRWNTHDKEKRYVERYIPTEVAEKEEVPDTQAMSEEPVAQPTPLALKAAHGLMYDVVYEVSGDVPEGYTAPAKQTLKVNEKYTVADVPASVTGTKDGVNGTYSFTGWKTAGGTMLSGDLELTDDITLYGVWTFTKKSSGHRPSTPTIDIPDDDVPTGLDLKNHYGYIIGYPVDYYTGQPTTDQTKKPVRPEGKITRAEVATIYFRMLTEENRAANWNQVSGFSDVKRSSWYNNAISTLTKAGILKGYEDGTFQPNGYITRAEFATIAIRFFNGVYEGKDLFPDIKDHWARDYINNAADKGLVKGYEDGTFGPDRYITRAEAVTLVNRTLNRHPHQDGLHEDMLVWPDNMDKTKWYYADMQEATNSHEPDKDKTDAQTEYWSKMLPIRDWEALEKEWSNANSAPGEGEVV